MPGLTPSSPPNASGSARGLVSTVAQTFAGAKTFLARIVATLGITSGAARLDLRSDLGAGSTDVCSVVGSTVADASVNGSAKLWSGRTGVGGTEVEYWAFTKVFNGFISPIGIGALSSAAAPLQLSVGGSSFVTALSRPLFLYAAGGSAITETVRIVGQRADAGLKCVVVGTEQATPDATCELFRVAKSIASAGNDAANGTAIARFIGPEGRLDRSGTDSSASPGAATINKPTGKSAIAIGASSVVITNSLVSATSRVHITPHARDATCKEIIAVPAAGSFTVSGTANATAALPFSWEVGDII